MPKQDPRVSKESLEYVDMFFRFVAGASSNDLESKIQLVELLDCLPDLVYAVNPRGNTALYNVVVSGLEVDLELARILVDRGAEPSAVNEENVGPYYGLRLIHDTDIQRKMGEILGLKFHHPSNSLVEADRAIAESRAYFAQTNIAKSEKALRKLESKDDKKPSGDGKCTIMSVHELTYEKSLKDLFANIQPLNMDQEKELNRMNLELHPLLRDISFHPMILETSNSNDIPIIVIPKEILEIGYEQFNNLLGNIYNFCFGSNLDSNDQ